MPGPSQISCPFFPYGVFWGRFFSGRPGTLKCSFSLITFAVAMFIFLLSLKWVMASQAVSNILQDLLSIFVCCFFLLTSGKCRIELA